MNKSEVARVYKGADEKSWQELLDSAMFKLGLLRPKGEEESAADCTYCKYSDGDGNCCKPTDCDKQEAKN